ncbi:MAG: biopolymer transporter ExbD [Acidaminococcaceae bacterium]|nr:biopolymer transporter ExbD [Acidaminococcaceae bacterium]MBQ9635632.1 biopolymer transporter ExbD [Acidaminococcaceae bacterium]MBQ9698642.1 biopolymer transporter ExbD [Acidaminococcaceae bacterium]MBR1590135.1 biopolymer transporter ExbD [Acidaminococcaceae bacterium]
MIKLKKRGRKAPDIMLSPMIDMMFLLLIFFIVSAMYMSELKTIPVKLPVATETITQSTVKFTVTIKDDGAYWLADKVIAKADLINRAREEQKKDEKFSVVIRADENVQYKAVISLLDSFKKAGISRVGLATDKEAKK